MTAFRIAVQQDAMQMQLQKKAAQGNADTPVRDSQKNVLQSLSSQTNSPYTTQAPQRGSYSTENEKAVKMPIPHGLTVKELKELTRIRLAREAGGSPGCALIANLKEETNLLKSFDGGLEIPMQMAEFVLDAPDADMLETGSSSKGSTTRSSRSNSSMSAADTTGLGIFDVSYLDQASPQVQVCGSATFKDSQPTLGTASGTWKNALTGFWSQKQSIQSSISSVKQLL
eukprot:CAMPEP_0113937138 /NCGR_PEP_ID=MMETSP1339-20121228/3831_1 /TAXON_ID=94617 /ORGANISM="Fibrocapsa japonica" /LENGTH=227 /DNA_ID=CAMNT_0000939803 /DNA_START=154 /DNA_END=837 /DNA_ORIENTATION=+ /assembly_acc=CAM_ASM_000762